MNAEDAAFLAALPNLAFGFVVVLARVAATVMLLPGLGEAEIPPMIRAALALVLTMLLLPLIQPVLPAEVPGPFATLAIVFAEGVTGAWIGWLARLFMLALPLAGQVAASMLGLTNVLQPDVTLGPQTSSLAKLFGAAAPVLLFASGMHSLPIAAMAGSFALVPPGHLLPAGDAVQMAIGAVAGCFALAVQFASPFILAGVVWQLGMGMLSRLVPQLQVYFAAMPGQILGGFILLAALSTAILGAWHDAAVGVLAVLPGL